MDGDLPEDHHCGYVAIAGVPNAGKSTLLNALMGMKLSIITSRPQSTRRNVLGILTEESYQAILMDTPGLLDPAYRLQSVMRAQALNAIRGCDVLLLMLDATKGDERELDDQLDTALEAVSSERPIVLAINKVDRVAKEEILPIMEYCADKRNFNAIVPISALKKDGLEPLLSEVVALLPVGPPHYPPDVITEHPERFFAAELVREVVFHRFSKEIPYATATQVEEFRRGGKKTYIRVNIYVERQSQKPILLGKGGKSLRQVGQAARKSIEEFLGEEVYLDLQVKVREDWRHRDAQLRDLDLL
ncbi:GTPase Era [Gemmatimonadota bacterium]